MELNTPKAAVPAKYPNHGFDLAQQPWTQFQALIRAS